MHIPDGYLDIPLIIATYVLTTSYYIIISKFRKVFIDMSKVSTVTTLAAGIFVAQMLSWPIPGGTSLHFNGGTLAAIIVGPYIASLTMTIVLVVQCLIFHDGGITALGANILNMAVINVWVGYLLYRLSKHVLRRSVGDVRAAVVGGFVGGWVGLTVAGIACGIEIGLSSLLPYGLMISLSIMASWHAILGVIEGLITGSVSYYLITRYPNILGS